VFVHAGTAFGLVPVWCRVAAAHRGRMPQRLPGGGMPPLLGAALDVQDVPVVWMSRKQGAGRGF